MVTHLPFGPSIHRLHLSFAQAQVQVNLIQFQLEVTGNIRRWVGLRTSGVVLSLGLGDLVACLF